MFAWRMGTRVSAVGVFLGLGCGGDDSGGTSVDPADPTSVWSRIEECGLDGDFDVSALRGEIAGCAAVPDRESVLSVRRIGGLATLSYEGIDLPAEVDLEECIVRAHGCRADTEEEPASQYLSLEVELDARDEDAVFANVAASEVSYGTEGLCSGELHMNITRRDNAAEPADGDCALVGTYEPIGTPDLSDDACSSLWDLSAIRIEEVGGANVLFLDSSEFDELSTESGTCSLSGIKGRDFDYWMYNGGMRTLDIEVTVDGDALVLEATDSLTGDTFDGSSCEGSITLRARRVATSAGPGSYVDLEAACSVRKPALCGDGVCEGDNHEGCGTCLEDCGCGDGQTCDATENACRTPCTFATEQTDCAAGERCDSTDSSGFSDQFCVPAGTGGANTRCDGHADCRAGLVCHTPSLRPSIYSGEEPGLCRSLCDDECTNCESDRLGGPAACVETCNAANDVTCGEQAWCWDPNNGSQTPRCLAIPEGVDLRSVGDSCNTSAWSGEAGSCLPGLSCRGACSGGACDSECTGPCDTDSDCPSSAPDCLYDSWAGSSFCDAGP